MAPQLAAGVMFEEILNEVDEILLQGTEEHVFPGAALWIGMGEETIKCSAYGRTADKRYQNYEPTAVHTQTLYDVASLTKVVATTCAIMHLAEEGRLRLDDPIARYIPQFGTDTIKASITIKHVLTHTTGLPGPLKLYQDYQGEASIIEGICTQSLLFQPGTQILYSDLGYILLGHIVQQISSLNLHQYTHAILFEPLGMLDTMFLPPAHLKHCIAPTEYVEWRGGLVHGIVHDENAWAMGGIAGHAGLFSIIEDLGRFCCMLLQQGQYGTRQILQAKSVAHMQSLHITNADESFGLGWMVNAPYFMGQLANNATFGHTGFTGTSLLLNSTHQVAVVLLTNRVCPSRSGPAINPYRQRIANAVAKVIKTEKYSQGRKY